MKRRTFLAGLGAAILAPFIPAAEATARTTKKAYRHVRNYFTNTDVYLNGQLMRPGEGHD